MQFAALPLGSSFRWKLVPAVLVVVLGDWMFYQRSLHGLNLGLFPLGLLAAMMAGRPAVRRNWRAWLAIVPALIFAAALAYDPSLLAWALFCITAGLASLLPLTGRFDDGWRWAQRLAWQAFRTPFAPLLDLSRLIKVRAAGRASRGSLRGMASLLGLPLAGSVVIVALFCAANPVFEHALTALVPSGLNGYTLVRVALWSVLFTMAWGLLRPRLALRLLPAFGGAGERRLPGVSVASVTLSLVVFNLIFALQNLLDVAYLWGITAMPAGMTMAQYAHRGAYPLVVTALLAALFVLVTLRPGSDTARAAPIRMLVTLWVGQNIFLVVSSMLRTIDYVEAYSLTRLRIAALAWMALVAFGLVAICWRALRGRSAAWLINLNLAAAGLVLTAASFIDLGAIAAQWNVDHAGEVGGQGAQLDLCYLDELGDSAVLPLIALERRANLEPEFRARVQAVRMVVHERLEEGQGNGWTLLGQQRIERAGQSLAGYRPAPVTPGGRSCDGTLLPAREPVALPDDIIAIQSPAPAAADPPAPPVPFSSAPPSPLPALTGARQR